MDCSPPGSSVHGDSPGKNTGVGCHALLQGIFLTQGSKPGLPHLPCEPPGKPFPVFRCLLNGAAVSGLATRATESGGHFTQSRSSPSWDECVLMSQRRLVSAASTTPIPPPALSLQGSQGGVFALAHLEVCKSTVWLMLPRLNAFPLSPWVKKLSSGGWTGSSGEGESGWQRKDSGRRGSGGGAVQGH